MANNITNVPVRTITDLTLLNYVPADINVLKAMKIPVGNLPTGFVGEAVSLAQLTELLPINSTTTSNIQRVANSVTEERNRAINAETLLQSHINQNQNGIYSYTTKADFVANQASIPINSTVRIAQGDSAGLFVWNGAELIPAEGDNLALANKYSDTIKDNLLQQLYNLRLGLQKINQALSNDANDLVEFQEQFSLYKQESSDLLNNITAYFESLKQADYNQHLAFFKLISAFNVLNTQVLGQKEYIYDVKLAVFKLIDAITGIENSVASSIKTPLKGTNNVYVFPAPKSIAIIDIVTTKDPLPSSGEEGTFTGEVSFTIDGQTAQLFSEIKVQGQSSAGFPKKNWSFDLYTDSTMKDSANLKIGRIRAHDSVNFKANWVDHLHCRQAFNLNLWFKIQDSRKGYPKWDIDNYYTGKTGTAAVPTGALASPIMFPAVCNINGEFYGVGCIHYAKKRGNYNISKNKPLEILIDFGGITAINVMDPNIIEIKAPSNPTTATLDAIQRWRDFANTSAANIKANYAAYLDKQNFIDYYCFVDFFCGADVVFKNLQMYTWNGKIWRIGVYDVDMSYGLDFDGKVWRFTPTYDAFQSDPFWANIRTAFKTEIEARYAELRKNGLFTVDHVYLGMSEWLSYYPTELLNAEYTKWNPPSLTDTNFAALMEWVKQRLVFLDSKHSYTGT